MTRIHHIVISWWKRLPAKAGIQLAKNWMPAYAGMTVTGMTVILGAVLLALDAPLAHAETYRVDLIVYLDKTAGGEAGRRPRPVDAPRAIEATNAAQLKAAGITILPESAFGLADAWQRLRSSKNYQPLIKLAWTQKDPPAERGPALRIRYGESFGVSTAEGMGEFSVSPVDGTVALLLGHYLHVDADLQYTVPTGSGSSSFRLRERRKMKRNVLHHLDGGRLGVLATVSKPGAAAP